MVERIYGLTIDKYGRCQHYHTKKDVIANKCSACGKFWACYQCHDRLSNHPFAPCAEDEPDTVMCGNCHATFSYFEYSKMTHCSKCGHEFNPNCKLHKDIYVN